MGALGTLPLNAQKCIAAKLILDDALRGEEDSAGDRIHDATLAEVRSRIVRAAHNALAGVAAQLSLEEFLARLPQRAAIDGDPGQHEHVERMAAAIEAAAEAYRAGDDPVDRAFATCVAASRELYARVGLPVDTEVSVSVGCVIEGNPHSLPLAGHAVAASVRDDDAGGRHVRLVLGAEELSWGAVRGIPSVLFHELVVHGFARRPPRGARSASPKFAEGWMDAVAREAHDAAVGAAEPLPAYAEAFDYPKDTLAAAAALHEARYEPPRFGNREMRMGRFVARGLQKLFCGSEVRGCDAFWTLSLALNRSSLDGVAADRVAENVHRALFGEAKDRDELAFLAARFDEAQREARSEEDVIAAAEAFAAACLSTFIR